MTHNVFLIFFFYFHLKLYIIYKNRIQNSSRTKEICANDFECESDNENRGCINTNKQWSSELASIPMRAGNKKNSPILPDQDLVRKIEKLEQEESRNGHYELVHIGKINSESSLKLNSTTPATTNLSKSPRDCTHWYRSNDIVNEFKKTSSLSNINGNNNNTESIGNQQLGSANLYVLRTRTHTKSLSTRISSLKRESKTTRTLSIVMFTFIACWLPFFIQYLLVSLFYKQHCFSGPFRKIWVLFR
jgi:7 transmembrane receptor (rhodopsin family)